MRSALLFSLMLIAAGSDTADGQWPGTTFIASGGDVWVTPEVFGEELWLMSSPHVLAQQLWPAGRTGLTLRTPILVGTFAAGDIFAFALRSTPTNTWTYGAGILGRVAGGFDVELWAQLSEQARGVTIFSVSGISGYAGNVHTDNAGSRGCCIDATVTPEPSSILLLCVGLLAIVALLRRPRTEDCPA
jgi:hypothetical protein